PDGAPIPPDAAASDAMQPTPDAAMADGAGSSIAIEPPMIRVPAGRDMIFVASTAATWSVMEPGGGTIHATGMYVAPHAPGTYRVVATSGGNAGVATVVVEQMYLPVVTGQPGGYGVVDGTGDEARFVMPRGVTFDGAHTLYVADEMFIRAVDTTTAAVTTIAG